MALRPACQAMALHLFRPRLFLFALLWPCCVAVVTNRTIDDTYGDLVTGAMPFYAPASAWNPSNCTGCFVQPDPSQLLNGTRHDSTARGATSSVTLQFSGTAIYFFCVVPNTIPNTNPPTITRYDLKFTLDNAVVGTYVHDPDNSLVFLYKVPVLSVQNLTNTSHLLLAETASDNSLFVFDFAIYTFDDGLEASDTSSIGGPSQSPSSAASASASHSTRSHTPIAAIVAGSVAGAIAMGAVFIIVLWIQKRSSLKDESAIPYTASAPEISALQDHPHPPSATTWTTLQSSDTGLPPYAATESHLVNAETVRVPRKR
ncbi:hypothetical protein FB45DRAFT_67865 [Roridomyces roridus]|uniref:Mid2 domain-containing protein n=1 Tax=Roridomyces roridus TaxID=1738132 RepID=A0AAD7BMJ2_9AGAR|nr:hypothetical protein FB45DRAFT_67865 [Roridomyces roridus]